MCRHPQNVKWVTGSKGQVCTPLDDQLHIRRWVSVRRDQGHSKASDLEKIEGLSSKLHLRDSGVQRNCTGRGRLHAEQGCHYPGHISPFYFFSWTFQWTLTCWDYYVSSKHKTWLEDNQSWELVIKNAPIHLCLPYQPCSIVMAGTTRMEWLGLAFFTSSFQGWLFSSWILLSGKEGSSFRHNYRLRRGITVVLRSVKPKQNIAANILTI